MEEECSRGVVQSRFQSRFQSRVQSRVQSRDRPVDSFFKKASCNDFIKYRCGVD